jgi:thiosulfate/3-mercaptopyruvate sulfurtransferase
MLRTSVLSLTIASLPALALATPQGWQPLLEPAQLAQILTENDNVRVVHVTGQFDAGHIPGAAFSGYGKWRAGPTNPGAVLPELEYELEVTRLGIDADTPVVLVHAGDSATDMGAAARVYWTLKSLGVQDLALLNGGFTGWVEAGLPVSTQAVPIAESDFQPEWSDQWHIPTAEVAALVESGDAILIDARPSGFFRGLDWSIARPGTIRGASNVDFNAFFDGTRMVDATRARALVEDKGLADAGDVVSFCNTGHWAALNWFVLSELAGVENTRLYAASMAEFTMHGHALDNEPNRIQFLWRSARRWAEGLFS